MVMEHENSCRRRFRQWPYCGTVGFVRPCEKCSADCRFRIRTVKFSSTAEDDHSTRLYAVPSKYHGIHQIESRFPVRLRRHPQLIVNLIPGVAASGARGGGGVPRNHVPDAMRVIGHGRNNERARSRRGRLSVGLHHSLHLDLALVGFRRHCLAQPKPAQALLLIHTTPWKCHHLATMFAICHKRG